MKYQMGFVLSGGGARGFAHLGIIQALLEKGIKPDVISGVSAGAIVGAFLSSGKTPHETHLLMKKGGFYTYSKIQIPKNGLMRLDGLQKVLEKEIPFSNIQDLPIPLYVGIANLTEGFMEYRNYGPLSKTVLASASIPVLFSPVEIDGCLYADGGLLENFPVEPLVGQCRKIVVSNISPLQKPAEIKNLIGIVIRTFLLSIHARIQNAQANADLYIEPQELTKFDILGISRADEMFEIGYNAVNSMDPQVFKSLEGSFIGKLLGK